MTRNIEFHTSFQHSTHILHCLKYYSISLLSLKVHSMELEVQSKPHLSAHRSSAFQSTKISLCIKFMSSYLKEQNAVLQ